MALNFIIGLIIINGAPTGFDVLTLDKDAPAGETCTLVNYTQKSLLNAIVKKQIVIENATVSKKIGKTSLRLYNCGEGAIGKLYKNEIDDDEAIKVLNISLVLAEVVDDNNENNVLGYVIGYTDGSFMCYTADYIVQHYTDLNIKYEGVKIQDGKLTLNMEKELPKINYSDYKQIASDPDDEADATLILGYTANAEQLNADILDETESDNVDEFEETCADIEDNEDDGALSFDDSANTDDFEDLSEPQIAADDADMVDDTEFLNMDGTDTDIADTDIDDTDIDDTDIDDTDIDDIDVDDTNIADTDIADTDIDDTDVDDTDIDDTDVDDTDIDDTVIDDTDVDGTGVDAIDDGETDFNLEDVDEDDFTIDDDVETEKNAGDTTDEDVDDDMVDDTEFLNMDGTDTDVDELDDVETDFDLEDADADDFTIDDDVETEENAGDTTEEDVAEDIANEEVAGNANTFVIDADGEELTTDDGVVNKAESSIESTDETVSVTEESSIVINNAVWKITCTGNRQYIIDDNDITQLLNVLNIKGLQTYSESAFTYITRIGDSLTNVNTDLVSVQQPANSKIRFADFVFTNCVNLLKFESAVELNEIPIGLFTNCVKLHDLEIPTSINVVNDFAFKGCKSLDCSELIKTNSLQRIGVCAFASTNIAEVTLPKSLKSLDAMAFSGCENLSVVNLTSTIATQWGNSLITYSKNSNTDDIMEKVQKSKAYVFAQCKNLQKVNLSKADILAIAKMQFVGTPYDKC